MERVLPPTMIRVSSIMTITLACLPNSALTGRFVWDSGPVRAPMDLVNDLAFMPDGKWWQGYDFDILGCWVFEGRFRCKIRCGRTDSGRTTVLWTRGSSGSTSFFLQLTFCMQDSVYSLAISPDGKWVASGSDDQSIWIWDTRTATVEYILDSFPNDENGEVNSLDFNPSGCYLVSGGDEGMVRIWRYALEVPISEGE
jgi:WD40 repeat protein